MILRSTLMQLSISMQTYMSIYTDCLNRIWIVQAWSGTFYGLLSKDSIRLLNDSGTTWEKLEKNLAKSWTKTTSHFVDPAGNLQKQYNEEKKL